MSEPLVLALAIVALLLAGIDEVRARGSALTSWAVICLALIPILGRLL